MFKINIKTVYKPYDYVGRSYVYRIGGTVRTIVRYDSDDTRYWTNLGTWISFKVFREQLSRGNIILE